MVRHGYDTIHLVGIDGDASYYYEDVSDGPNAMIDVRAYGLDSPTARPQGRPTSLGDPHPATSFGIIPYMEEFLRHNKVNLVWLNPTYDHTRSQKRKLAETARRLEAWARAARAT